ncbi:permease [Achromobacter xylosoxidans]|nr:permease [Achromobacter xylosoxidans]
MDSLYVVVVVGAMAAGFVQGLSGFGFGMVAMSFWAWTVDPRLAAAMAVFGALTGQLLAAFTVRRGFAAAHLLPFVAGGLLGIPLGGFTGVIPTLWCTLRGFDRDVQRAVIQNFNLSMLMVTMASYVLTGVVTRDMLPLFALIVPAMLVPTLLGTRVYVGISDVAFRRVVLGLLTVSGVALLASSVPRLLG